jgi:tRNA (guanine37-N1)-methyltransferase
MRPDVVHDALESVADAPGPVIYLTPRGRPLDQALVRELARGPGMTVLCGRYEGVDERVLEAHAVLEVSLGDFVLSGGEPAAIALIDACVRLLPGVMGDEASLEEESFQAGLLEYPHYTRPAEWLGRPVPDVLLGTTRRSAPGGANRPSASRGNGGPISGRVRSRGHRTRR